MTVDLEYEPPADLPDTFRRMPPHDRDAEQCVLGGMIVSAGAIADVAEILKPGHFYLPVHETLYIVILAMYTRGDPVDPITLAAELTKRGDLARLGGVNYLHELVNAPPTASNAAYYAEIVKQKAILRRVAEAGARMNQMALEGGEDAVAIADAAQAELSAAVDVTENQQAELIGADWEQFLDRLESKEQAMGIPTGLRDLDELLHGLHPGQMIVVAARPAMGKSTLALDFARSCCFRHDMAAVYFSLEMSREEIQMRTVSAEARVGLHRIRSKDLTDDDWTRIAEKMPLITGGPLFIDASPNLTMAQVKAKARRLKQRNDVKLVIIDYLQLMQSGSGRRAENRQLEVSEMSRGVKLLAKELEVPVVVLSQLNRGPEQRQDKKPAISDLRESGSIEQDADVVILLHREDAYEKESPRAGEADLIVGKHRNGPTATVTVASQLYLSRFVDMAEE